MLPEQPCGRKGPRRPRVICRQASSGGGLGCRRPRCTRGWLRRPRTEWATSLFEASKEALDDGVVPAVAAPAHTAFDGVRFESTLVVKAGVLRRLNWSSLKCYLVVSSQNASPGVFQPSDFRGRELSAAREAARAGTFLCLDPKSVTSQVRWACCQDSQ